MTAVHIHYTKAMLLRDLHESRAYYLGLGWGVQQCAIGSNPFAEHIRLACDTGAIDYTFAEDGQIRRQTSGCYSKLIEFIDTDLADHITRHNQAIRDRQLLSLS